MKWISALELGVWANTLQAENKLPELVSEMIWATASKVRRQRFLYGDMGQVRGYDGYLDADSNSPFVPDGKSIWEFGTNSAGKAKAEQDYKKRTDEVDSQTRSDHTLVLVSPRTWNTPQDKVEDWLAEKNKSAQWKRVVYVDGQILEDWLQKCPAVSSRWARSDFQLAPQNGVLSTEEFWIEFSSQFKPCLVEEVLLAGRESQAEDLLLKLAREDGCWAFSADTSDEVIAFAVAAIRKAPDTVRKFLESRTLIVETEEAARHLASTSNLIYLPRKAARKSAGLLMKRGPTVISAGVSDKKIDHVELRRPLSSELSKAFVLMGMSKSEAYDSARSCGRSLAVFARLNPNGYTEYPEWRESGLELVPALLAGAWDSDVEHDKNILSSLSEQDYDDAEDALRKYLQMSDSPIECEDNLWATRAPVDVFLNIASQIGRRHLKLFREALIAVFDTAVASHAPPKAEDAFVMPTKRAIATEHSEHLKKGMLTTLLHMAVLHSPACFTAAGKDPQRYVDELVQSITGLSSNSVLIASLEQNLQLLAEASPNSFLEALERQLEGDSPSIRPIFDEHPGVLSSVTYHCGLLWSLEVLAWDATSFERAVRCLAKLAAIDPGGRLTNRPINSLREIFLSWSPCTSVRTNRRLAVLQSIVKQVPTIAWPLLVSLLPRTGDISSPTARPKFRDYERDDREKLTYGLVWESEAKIIALALNEAGALPDRWEALIGAMAHFQEAPFSALTNRLDEVLGEVSGEDRVSIWKSLNVEVKRHQKYSNANWAMSEERLKRLLFVADKHAPEELVESQSWLFDDWMPPVEGVDDEDADPIELVEDARLVALRTIHEARGVPGLLALLKRAAHARLVMSTISRLELTYEQLWELFTSTLANDSKQMDLAASFSLAEGVSHFGQQWMEEARAVLLHSDLTVECLAQVFAFVPDELRIWLYVESFGADVERAYWSQKAPYPLTLDTNELLYAMKKYLMVDRPTAALSAASRRLKDIPSQLVISLLKAGVGEHNSNSVTSSFFDVEKVIDDLAERSDVAIEEAASLEFIYLQALREEPKNLHKMLLEQPEFFMGMVRRVFRANGAEPSEVSDIDRKHASNAFRLLKSLNRLPGQSGEEVNEQFLLSWCQEVRRLGVESDREAITDQMIGQVLAHAPVSHEDGAWPHEAVRHVIEALASEEIELGIQIERFNMRGVVVKNMGEGGEQERVLEQQTRGWAKASVNFVRTSAMLELIADSWASDAERADSQAKQWAMRE
ncbi:hypothetical protein [Pseudomonas parafulva]|uniref:hypothetical protein n=1 Tax=Pseudomonas parafulva TaxID=157782 RepID=UPI000734BE49|nr:hypothetical protein [Pseudomonas parafulva]KTT01687.1 hypothetical protein NS212_04810 [Pseudomonas parafulva]